MAKDTSNPLANPDNQDKATQLVHGGILRSPFGEASEALFMTSGYLYDSPEAAEARFNGEDPGGFIYSRFSNPTVEMFQQRMCLLEDAEDARATASGMAAVTASVLAQIKAGDHVVAAKALFGSCRYVIEDLMPQFGVEFTLVDGANLDAWKAAMQPNTKLCFLESPTNPTLELVDIAGVADIAHEAGARLIVDNVFATPLWQSPLKLGADLVVYSTTKHIDGQGRSLGGIILGSTELIEENIHNFLRQTGPAMSPFNAWLLLKGLETLPLRVERMTENGAQVAHFLAGHNKISRMMYPGHESHPQYELGQQQMSGGSNMVAFELTGGKAAAFRMMNGLEVIKIANNLGDAKSLITHPSTTTHQRLSEEDRLELGITQGIVRLSCGLESADDLIKDLSFALDQI